MFDDEFTTIDAYDREMDAYGDLIDRFEEPEADDEFWDYGDDLAYEGGWAE
jgi:hypothetical protein